MRVCIVIVIKLGCPSGSEREEGKEGPSKSNKDNDSCSSCPKEQERCPITCCRSRLSQQCCCNKREKPDIVSAVLNKPAVTFRLEDLHGGASSWNKKRGASNKTFQRDFLVLIKFRILLNDLSMDTYWTQNNKKSQKYAYVYVQNASKMCAKCI